MIWRLIILPDAERDFNKIPDLTHNRVRVSVDGIHPPLKWGAFCLSSS